MAAGCSSPRAAAWPHTTCWGVAEKGGAAEPVANRGELGAGLNPNRGELGADRVEPDRQELGAANRARQLVTGQLFRTRPRRHSVFAESLQESRFVCRSPSIPGTCLQHVGGALVLHRGFSAARCIEDGGVSTAECELRDEPLVAYLLDAQALAGKYTFVTQEVPSPSHQRIKIPNVCLGLKVKCLATYETLRSEHARFVLSPDKKRLALAGDNRLAEPAVTAAAPNHPARHDADLPSHPLQLARTAH